MQSNNATATFLNLVMKNSGCNLEQANKVMAIYKKHKVLKFTNDTTPHVVHGAFYDKETIWNVINNH